MVAELLEDGWQAHHIWEHSDHVRDLYTARARGEAEEMTCAAQAAELFEPLVRPGEALLDVGCGSGYFLHSLKRRNVPLDYFGIDAAPSLVAIGRRELAAHGLPADRLRVLRIEDLNGAFDHVLCMNVLSNIDNWHRPLERLLKVARRSVILRESLKPDASYLYVRDAFLNPGVDLSVHVNAYDIGEFTRFIADRGFTFRVVEDRRSRGQPEMVIGYPHWWTFIVAERSA
jgi:SAM-dependent methyltransferase